MPKESIRNFFINDQEYFINLEEIDIGVIRFDIKINNLLYEFVYDDHLRGFKCYEVLEGLSKKIFNEDFISYHVDNFFKIFNKNTFFEIPDENIIDFEGNKLILSNDDEMFFFDDSSQILYEMLNYNISSVKLIYTYNSSKKINYTKSQKKLNNLIKFNYDLLELKLLKIEINNLNLYLQQIGDDELADELKIELKKLENEYKLKLISSLDLRNHSDQNSKRKINSKYFTIIFNNSWLFKTSKKLINLVEIEYYLYKSHPVFYIYFLGKFLNALLVPLIDLMLGITGLMAFNYYYEKKIEIDEQREKLAEIIHDFNIITENQKKSKNSILKFFYNLVDFVFLYSFEMVYFLATEILSIFKRPIFFIKKSLAFI